MKRWTEKVSPNEWVRGGEGFGGYLCPKCGSGHFDYSTFWFKYDCYDCGFYTEELAPEYYEETNEI